MNIEQFVKDFKDDINKKVDNLEKKMDLILNNCQTHASKLGETKVYNKITWALFTLIASGEVLLALFK